MQYKKLGEICEIKTGKLDANAASENGKYPFFTCSKETLSIDSYSYDCECVLIAGNGELNVKYFNGKFDAYQRTYIVTLKKGIDYISIRYIYTFFTKYIDVLKTQTIGGVIKYIKMNNLSEAILPVPSLSSQSRIVAELDLLTSLIDNQKKQLDEFNKLQQSTFFDMFGDPVENEKKWPVKKLGEVCSKIGSGATPHGGNENYKEEGISLIRSLNVYNGSFKYKDLAYIDEEQAKALDNVTIYENDVLLNITGASVARCCIVPNDVLPARVNQHVCILRTNVMNQLFLCYQLISEEYQQKLIFDSKTNGATREALPKNLVSNLPIILPPLSLQTAFAEKISAIEEMKKNLKASIAETQRLFDSRMQEIFG